MRTQVAPGGYIDAGSAFEDELGRLRLLQERYDARTFGRLSALGPLDGTACLEVGAGWGRVGLRRSRPGPRGSAIVGLSGSDGRQERCKWQARDCGAARSSVPRRRPA
jgi:hypothetical protein